MTTQPTEQIIAQIEWLRHWKCIYVGVLWLYFSDFEQVYICTVLSIKSGLLFNKLPGNRSLLKVNKDVPRKM